MRRSHIFFFSHPGISYLGLYSIFIQDVCREAAFLDHRSWLHHRSSLRRKIRKFRLCLGPSPPPQHFKGCSPFPPRDTLLGAITQLEQPVALSFVLWTWMVRTAAARGMGRTRISSYC